MNSAPPKINSSGTRLLIIILAAAFVGVAVVIYFFNPVKHPFYPECQFHRLTGLNCPGCGSTRAVYALLHGHLLQALRDNALFTGGSFLLLLRGGWFFWKKRQGQKTGEFFPAKYLWLLLIVALVFTVIRNLPAFAFLSP